ncbi:MAG: pantoate--beta-alanine ligase [Planctomycetaceae bacterium]|jgi:pantoate--beta-alanine ligase|nr:pantoate--beta-alanine ligase [Planctomycetaceae bacterium]MBT5125401.1 pantoate--beta-alanine ligase [Planctomycetaceae bacterium]MBT7253991.1 pantoate--beta-alanine ligase [Planctomycetaceae bacterium]
MPNSPELITDLTQLAQWVQAQSAAGLSVGLVPTMGALHAGHLSLVESAAQHSDSVLVTIFVNPTQFAANEDLQQYPRDLEGDLQLLQSVAKVTVFAPTVADIYPLENSTARNVESNKLDDVAMRWEGERRPGHFLGVTTIVHKLFTLTKPQIAFFGRKDYQQLRVIEQLTEERQHNIKIVGCPIVREEDGLAMSSRNAYLTTAQRTQATAIYKGLQTACNMANNMEMAATELQDVVRKQLANAEINGIDYVAVVHPKSLEPLALLDRTEQIKQIKLGAIILVAVFVGNTRLIDNIFIPPNNS